MVMVHVKVVEEVRDIVEIVSVMDKHVYKVKGEISRELTTTTSSCFCTSSMYSILSHWLSKTAEN